MQMQVYVKTHKTIKTKSLSCISNGASNAKVMGSVPKE